MPGIGPSWSMSSSSRRRPWCLWVMPHRFLRQRTECCTTICLTHRKRTVGHRRHRGCGRSTPSREAPASSGSRLRFGLSKAASRPPDGRRLPRPAPEGAREGTGLEVAERRGHLAQGNPGLGQQLASDLEPRLVDKALEPRAPSARRCRLKVRRWMAKRSATVAAEQRLVRITVRSMRRRLSFQSSSRATSSARTRASNTSRKTGSPRIAPSRRKDEGSDLLVEAHGGLEEAAVRFWAAGACRGSTSSGAQSDPHSSA